MLFFLRLYFFRIASNFHVILKKNVEQIIYPLDSLKNVTFIITLLLLYFALYSLAQHRSRTCVSELFVLTRASAIPRCR